MTAALLIEHPTVQGKLTDKVLTSLEAKLGGSFSVGSITIRPFNAVVITDFAVIDKEPYTDESGGRGWPRIDTLLQAKTVIATFSLRGLLSNEGVHLGRAIVKDGGMHLSIEPGGDEFPTNLNRVINKFGNPNVRHEPTSSIFDIRHVRIRNFRFRMNNQGPATGEPDGYGIHWDDLDVRVSSLRAHSLSFSGGRMYGVLDDLKCSEKSGYVILSMKGRARVGMGICNLEHLHLVDPWSDVKMPILRFNYECPASWGNFCDEVKITGKAIDSHFTFNSLAYFAPALAGNGTDLDISDLRVSGPVNDLEIVRLKTKDRNSGCSIDATGHITSVCDPAAMLFDIKAKSLGFTTKGAGRFVSEFSHAPNDLGKFARGMQFNGNADVSGHLQKMKVRLDAKDGSGAELKTSLDIRNLSSSRPLEVGGKLATRNLDLGRIAGIDKIGNTSMQFSGRGILAPGAPSVIVDSLIINDIKALGLSFRDIKAAGRLSGGRVDAILVSNDPKLKLSAEVNAGSDIEDADITARIAGIDLAALGIDKRNEMSRLSMDLSLKEMELNARDIRVTYPDEVRELGAVRISSERHGKSYTSTLSSEIANGILESDASPVNFPADIIHSLLRRPLPSLFPASSADKGTDSRSYRLAIDIKDMRSLLPLLAPGTYVAEGTRLNLDMREGVPLTMRFSSPRIAMSSNYVKDIDFTVDNTGGALNLRGTGGEARLSEFKLESMSVDGYAVSDTASVSLHFNGEKENDSFGDIFVNAFLERTPGDSLRTELHFLDSDIRLRGTDWKIAESRASSCGGDCSFEGFRIFSADGSDEGSISIDGGLSRTHSETLSVGLQNINLAILSSFLKSGIAIGGRTDGFAVISSPQGNEFKMTAKMSIDSLAIGNEPIGNFLAVGSWDKAGRKYNAYLTGTGHEGDKILTAAGHYSPGTGDISADASLSSFKLAVMNPFLESLFSEMNGALSGKVSVRGKLPEPVISSEGITLEDAGLRLAYTNVLYRLNGRMDLDGSGINLDGITIEDPENGQGRLKGRITYSNFKDMRLDTGMEFKDMLVLDKQQENLNGIYGRMYATASVTARGPVDDLEIEGAVRTAKSGSVRIPTGSAEAKAGTDLLTFEENKVQCEDDIYEETLGKEEEKNNSKTGAHLSLKLNAKADPQTEAILEMEKSLGNKIAATGNANINVEIDRSGKLSLSGEYLLSGGKIHFTIPGAGISKDFTIKEGGILRLGGDLRESSMDITAVYQVKTSLSRLITDSTATATRRAVDCEIRLSGTLNTPEIGFKVNIPDLDPTTKSQVDAALSSEDKEQKQFIALLVMGSFIPDELSGIVNGNNLIYKNVGEIMAGQLNNILQRLNIPLDLGLGYQQNEGGTNIFDVAISTQLFNNRVVVNGNVGNRQYRTNPGTSVVGDIDVEVKIDRPGNFRVKAFSHSADEHTSFLDYSQRNGLGVSFQKEFDTAREFFSSIFKGNKKKKDKNEKTVSDSNPAGGK